ncbi:polyol transporter [Perilla frutescens var. hirtella]|uniref:Polyol transporter n=1 Tax=Perilla frutescens var. hirtella TaxID=608512 RepID=A0AAD4IT13_PERFH|nr:polyol transporter [Perilla frutescens var. frutescens]KAH6776524.1 polyol transporter [Perilla frutescens var. hirtella]KAH6796256.1 hypothetical protein C2S51_037242 [Perilla frutescens var. frutescens]KAH6820807.1 polyol transporter [Perilla frutescens var. hirtella]
MRDEEGQKVQTNPSSSSSTNGAGNMSVKKEGCGLEGLFGRGKYKLWALGAITLLAVWSMFTGTVTLKWSDVNLKHISTDLDPSLHSDLDVLDVDEREKMVRQMWNVYKHSSVAKLPIFWRDAFGAAYQDLTSEVATVRNAALWEIAKMSFGSTGISDPHPAARESKEDGRVRIKLGKTRKQK